MRIAMYGIALCFTVFFVLCTGSLSQAMASENSPESPKLRKVVVLSRHGVRAPTQSTAKLEEWSARPWPRWPVKRGYLTPRGGQLVTAMWENMRTHYVDLGLLPEAGCPVQGQVFVYADVDQRTRETARALLRGLAPGCNLPYAFAKGRIDPLFHPARSVLQALAPTVSGVELPGLRQEDIAAARRELNPLVQRISELAAPPSEEFCARYSLPPGCTMAEAPSPLRVSRDGRDISISGALGIASTMAEIFLLEYGQWPKRPAAWGQVDQQVMKDVLPLHTQVFNMVNRAPVVAWARGSALLRAISDALEGKHDDPRYNRAALVVLVGHDTNIATVGALLGVHWQPPQYPADSTTPAAALCFELWEHPPKIPGQKPALEVRMAFYAQPLQVLHRAWDKTGDKHSTARAYAPEAAVMSGNDRLALDDFTDLVRRKTLDTPRE